MRLRLPYVLALALSASCGDNLAPISGSVTVAPTTGLQVNEQGGASAVTIALSRVPTGDVTIPLSSGDATEGTVSPASLTFTPESWSSGQVVTVTGVDDAIADGAQIFAIVLEPMVSDDD